MSLILTTMLGTSTFSTSVHSDDDDNPVEGKRITSRIWNNNDNYSYIYSTISKSNTISKPGKVNKIWIIDLPQPRLGHDPSCLLLFHVHRLSNRSGFQIRAKALRKEWLIETNIVQLLFDQGVNTFKQLELLSKSPVSEFHALFPHLLSRTQASFQSFVYNVFRECACS